MNWQPIDTAPQDGDIFLLWEPDGHYVVGFYHFKRKAWVSLAGDDPNDELKPSHWMDLPPEPNYEPTEAQQGLIPIPDGYKEQ